jgi:hypothetical protein
MQTNRERFLESLINRDHVVLGRKLRPLCLWHMIHLARVQSPLLTGRKPSRADLMLAVAICASEPESIINDLMPQASEIGLFSWKAETAKFRTYQRDFSAPPRRHDPKGKSLQCPWELAVVARLMLYGHMTKREALVEPFGLAMWLCAALGEANGGDPGVMNADEEKALIASGVIDAR